MHSIPGYDTWKLASPPDIEPPDEKCDSCHKEIGDDWAIKLQLSGLYYCGDCATKVERCDQCNYIRCVCGDAR